VDCLGINPASGALPPAELEAIPFQELEADKMAELAVSPGRLVAKGTLKNAVRMTAPEGIETQEIFTTSF